MTKSLPLLLVTVLLAGPAQADKITRTVSKDGTPKIFIRGEAGKGRINRSQPPISSAEPAEEKDFAVYELERPTTSGPITPTVIVIGTPPPIAPSAAAYGYGYGYPGYGYPAYGYPGYRYPVRPHCAPVPWRPAHRSGSRTNYQNRPVNYQNPPVNYQNSPVNYQTGAGAASYRGARHR